MKIVVSCRNKISHVFRDFLGVERIVQVGFHSQASKLVIHGIGHAARNLKYLVALFGHGVCTACAAADARATAHWTSAGSPCCDLFLILFLSPPIMSEQPVASRSSRKGKEREPAQAEALLERMITLQRSKNA